MLSATYATDGSKLKQQIEVHHLKENQSFSTYAFHQKEDSSSLHSTKANDA